MWVACSRSHTTTFSFCHLSFFFFRLPPFPTSPCLPPATHSCPAQGAGERSLERRCTCSFLLLNREHQSRRCLHQRREAVKALHMQPETIYQQTGHVNVAFQLLSHVERVSCSALVCLGRWEQGRGGRETPENLDVSGLQSKWQRGLLAVKTTRNNRKHEGLTVSGLTRTELFLCVLQHQTMENFNDQQVSYDLQSFLDRSFQNSLSFSGPMLE